MSTDRTWLSRVDSISGMEKLRKACDATQIQPLMNDGNSNGRTIRRMMTGQRAPEVRPASSIS